MALFYPIQTKGHLIGSEGAPSVLTANYADNTAVCPAGSMVESGVYFEYTPAENNASLLMKMEGSLNGTVFYQFTTTRVGIDGVVTRTDRIDEYVGVEKEIVYRRKISEPVADKFIRLSFKEVATSHGTLKVVSLLSGK